MSSLKIRCDATRERSAQDGQLLPAFIDNNNFFLTELGIYADGIVECWGAVDLDFLQRKFNQGWVKASVPSGSRLDVWSLVDGVVEDGEWLLDADQLHRRILSTVAELNPGLLNLYDFQGSDVDVVGHMRYSKLGFVQSTPWRSNAAGESRWALVKSGDEYSVTGLRFFADGLVDIHPALGESLLVPVAQLPTLVAENTICLTAPDDAWLRIEPLGRFRLKDPSWHTHTDDFLAETRDILCQLRGEEDSLSRCRRVMAEYLQDPTVMRREALREAYEAVPEHLRRFAGDQDTKDIPIRMILYGDQEIENWTHLIVSRHLDLADLPDIQVPKPRDE